MECILVGLIKSMLLLRHVSTLVSPSRSGSAWLMSCETAQKKGAVSHLRVQHWLGGNTNAFYHARLLCRLPEPLTLYIRLAIVLPRQAWEWRQTSSV